MPGGALRMLRYATSRTCSFSSMGFPNTLNARPSKDSPTGTRRSVPVSRMAEPRAKPRVPVSPTPRTVWSSRCRSTSIFISLRSPHDRMFRSGGRDSGNLASTMLPRTETIFPMLRRPSFMLRVARCVLLILCFEAEPISQCRNIAILDFVKENNRK